jgi:diguanylate cyclase (GGDEF)-like protein
MEPAEATRSSILRKVRRIPAVLDRYLGWFVENVAAPQLAGLDDQRRAKLLVVTCHTAGVLVLLSFTLRALVHEVPDATWVVTAAVTSVVLLGSPFLMRGASSVRAAALPPILALALAMPILTAAGGGLDAPIVTMVPAMPLVAAYFIGPRGAAWLAVVLTVEVVAMAIGERVGWSPPHHTPALVKALLIAAFLGVTAFIARVYDRERQRFESKLQQLNEQLREVSIRDPLTGAYNRRHLSERLISELAYARRHRMPLAVVILDVDHFKRVNDQHGHHAGDAVLTQLVALVQSEIRQEDLLARYGGEEFVLMLRDTDARQAEIVAERVRAMVESSELTYAGKSIFVTLSLGCAAASAEASEEALVAAADARLYEAKRRGRNCVVGEGTVPARMEPSSPPATASAG